MKPFLSRAAPIAICLAGAFFSVWVGVLAVRAGNLRVALTALFVATPIFLFTIVQVLRGKTKMVFREPSKATQPAHPAKRHESPRD